MCDAHPEQDVRNGQRIANSIFAIRFYFQRPVKKFIIILCLLTFGCAVFSIQAYAADRFESETISILLAASERSVVADVVAVEAVPYRPADLGRRIHGCEFLPPPCGKNGSFRSRIKLYGWFEAGLFLNAHGDRSEHYRTLNRRENSGKQAIPTSGNSNLLGNVRSTELSLNQLWLGVRRDLDTRRGFDWGFRADLLFGTDAWLAQNFGDATFDYDMDFNRDYYFSVPRLYASFGYEKFSMKIGKFESLLGYETLESPDAFFYSRSNLFYTMPQTHTGVLGEYRFHPTFRLAFGYVLGADNSFENRFDDHGFLGAFYWRPVSSLGVCYAIYLADRGHGRYANGETHFGGTIYQHSLTLDWNISKRWNYVFQWSLGDRDGGHRSPSAHYFGSAHYLTYCVNRKLSVGLRLEQIHSNGPMVVSGFGTPLTGYYEGDLFGLSFGLNWMPYQRLSVRPELRYDKADDCRPFDDGRSRDQFSAGCGLVYVF